MRSYRVLARWMGIPIFWHWSIFLCLPWFYWQSRGIYDTVIMFFSYFLLLAAHELGHAVIAIRRKTNVKSIRLFILHGECHHDETYCEVDDVYIAWGGIFAQLIILFIALFLNIALSALFPWLQPWLKPIFWVFIKLNIITIVFNLIPVAPLDGHKAWRAIPLLKGWLQPKWRQIFLERKRKKKKMLQAESERVTAEIIEKLKRK